MKVEFIEDRTLASGRQVKAGEKITVSTADGEAFILNGVAKQIKPKTEVKSDGQSICCTG